MVGRDHIAGRCQGIVAVGNLIRGRDRKVVDPRRAGEVAEIDDPGNDGMGFGVDDDVVRVEVVVDGLVRQLRQYRQGAGFEAAENVLDQTAPLARDGVDQRPQFGGVLKVPQQFVIGARNG